MNSHWNKVKMNVFSGSLLCFVTDLKSCIIFKAKFLCSLFLRITTLLTWLKSTLLLKIKCFDTTIYMKTQCLKTNEIQNYSRKENAWEAGQGREMVALIKSLICEIEKTSLRCDCKRLSWKC